MKWEMFTKQTSIYIKWASSPKKYPMNFHEMSHVRPKLKTAHDLPWNEPCSFKESTLTFHEMSNVHQIKHVTFHEFAWNYQQNIEQSAVLQVRGLMPVPQLRWAVSFVGFDPMNIWRFLWNIRRYDIYNNHMYIDYRDNRKPIIYYIYIIWLLRFLYFEVSSSHRAPVTMNHEFCEFPPSIGGCTIFVFVQERGCLVIGSRG